MQETKVQWHPGFIAAMNLEFIQNKEDLLFEKEHNLNTKPLEIDLLVIKKETSIQITNEIGKFFRGHNIIEYKSPKDHLDIDTFYKSQAYASLYKSYGKIVDERKADDITVSMIRQAKPKGLFQYFKEHGYSVSNPYPGIYHIEGGVLFPTQIIVTRELKWELHSWLGALSDKLKKRDMLDLLEKSTHLKGKADREFAGSVLEVAIAANRQVFEELKGDGGMFETLMEIFEPEIQVILQKGIEQGREEGIRGTAEVLRELGYDDSEITSVIMKKYGLSREEAQKFVNYA